MKKLLSVIALLVGCVVAEPEAPYPPSGFRPSGPAFELPQKTTQQQQYLPPVDPRQPLPPTEYGVPDEEDVSVQGLPAQEQQPIFQVSPVNGQLYVGPQFNTDLRNLDTSDSFRFNQYQLQQQKYREFERQRELEAAQARTRANQFPNTQVPRQFGQTTPGTTESTKTVEDKTESTTEAIELNEGETLDNNKKDDKPKVTVEVSKQNLQEYPGELFLSSLAQLQLQPQFIPVQQFGQLNAPLQYQPVQDTRGYDAQTHFAALPSVLAQRQSVQPQYQQGFVNPALLVASPDPVSPLVPQNQYQPLNQYSPQVQMYPQPIVVQQPQFVQPQQPQSDENRQNQPQNDENRQDQDQFVYQQSYQPQQVYQPQFSQPDQQNYILPQAPQNFLPQAQLVNYPQLVQYQNQAPQFQGQDSLQSGIDLNQRNDVEDQKSDDEEENDGSNATAVATAFGARTQPHVMTRYGAPNPRVSYNPIATTESQDETATENAGAVAEANAFATGQRRPAKLRSRRVRPIFTLDRSGHLVLAQDQN